MADIRRVADALMSSHGVILHTARLQLRPATEEDLDELWALWTEPRVRLYLWDDIAIERDQARDTIRDCAALAEQGLGLWTIRLLESGGSPAAERRL